ncbi:MAG TPA: aminotransferase class V-fold PLP-dependent enzyme [Kineosporiaceae bacterium]
MTTLLAPTCAHAAPADAPDPGHSSDVADRDALAPLLPVVGSDLPAPLVDGGSIRYANLDYAASAPALTAVAEHLAQALPYYSSVHRGAGFASQVTTRLYESARSCVADFLGARADDVVVFTRNTTDALNLLAGAVPEGSGDVIFLDVEHHANLLPWQARTHRCVPVSHTLAGTVERLADALREKPAALVAVTGSSNVTGEILPLARIAALAHAHGARIAVDAAQLAPHRRIDVSALGVDYLALSGHKLYAPFGAGALVGRRDWLDAASPYLAGGGAVREVRAEHTEWAPAPHRHEAGTPNVLGAAALAAACRTIAALPAGAVQAHEGALRERLIRGLRALPDVRLLQIWPDSTERIGVVAFVVDGHDSGRVAAYLSAEHGIGVRDGRFCAHPLLARLGHRDGALRASLGLGSSADDVDRLITAVARLVTDGERWDYAVRNGRWVPVPDPRPTAPWLTGADDAAAGASPCTD